MACDPVAKLEQTRQKAWRATRELKAAHVHTATVNVKATPPLVLVIDEMVIAAAGIPTVSASALARSA
jgi:hypothetical protein